MKRYIITTGGGLGNQIMTYALWYYLSKERKQILYLRKNELNDIFPLSYNSTPRSKIMDAYIAFHKRYNAYFLTIKKRLKEIKFLKYFELSWAVVDYPEWSDYLFWENIQKEIRPHLAFKTDKDMRNIRLMNRIHECNSVSIHVRRGDYQNNVYWRLMLGDICDETYYNKAIDRVSELIDSPVYFIFSDDILWVKRNLKIENAVFVDWNTDEKSYRDMQLMSCCKINILANSTFSLTATWLNLNSNPIRIVPFKWTNFYEDDLLKKYIPSDWIVIDNKRPMVSIIIKDSLSLRDVRNLLRQHFTDFEIIYYNNQYNKIDPRISTLQPSGMLHYLYEKNTDLKKFKSKKHLQEWIVFIWKNNVNDR